MKILNKIVFTICLMLLAVFSFAGDGYKKINQQQYLPDAVKDFYIGMPFSEFVKLRDITKMDQDNSYSSTYLQYGDQTVPKGLVNIVYKFDSDDPDATRPLAASPLYEIRLEFENGYDINGLTAKLYGPAKDIYKEGDDYHFYDKQWIVTTKDKLTLIIRQTGNYLMIAGVIKGTEWSTE